MAAEKSHSSLGIPADLAAVLSSIDSEKHEIPVWTFAKHESGYSLKLFWKFKRMKLHLKPTPFPEGIPKLNKEEVIEAEGE